MLPIRACALDVDGVLTDGSVWWGENGEEFKKFHYLDIMGVSRATQKGIVFALISGEDSPLVDRFAAKLKIMHVHKGCKDKAAALRFFSESIGIPLEAILFMGDDINDLQAMALAGVAAAPANAHPHAIASARIITTRHGGCGAVREVLERVLGHLS
jgi:3-deoxy-D-manno-octulosonate 8-phosphate phosphatase (KDO 8-P phosphatase)